MSGKEHTKRSTEYREAILPAHWIKPGGYVKSKDADGNPVWRRVKRVEKVYNGASDTFMLLYENGTGETFEKCNSPLLDCLVPCE